jgi:tetratricopeptide (TPR) repeat protein
VSLSALAMRIGPAYLLLFLFVQLLSGAGGQLAQILAGLVPAWAAAGALAFGFMYMHLVTFHLLGYVIYQYHEELGFEVDVRQDQSGGEAARPAADPGQSVLGQVDVLLKEGRLDRAEALLREQIDADPTDLGVWQRYYRVLEARGDDQRLLHESKDYISALLLAGRAGPALEVAEQAMARDPSFRPAKAEQVYQLARTAREANRPKVALRLMNGFGRHHPDHPDLPHVSVLSARVLSEDLRQDAKARPILEALLKRFPDHPAADEAQRLLQVIGPA